MQAVKDLGVDFEEAERNEQRTSVEKRDTVVQVSDLLAHD
jgi:hypothetical protein